MKQYKLEAEEEEEEEEEEKEKMEARVPVSSRIDNGAVKTVRLQEAAALMEHAMKVGRFVVAQEEEERLSKENHQEQTAEEVVAATGQRRW